MFKRSIRNEVVYIANGYLEAESIKIFLESFGIPAYTNQESAGLAYGFTVGQLGEVEILVPLDKVEEAKKVIEDMKTGKLEDQSGDN
jgi:hypothetical protein